MKKIVGTAFLTLPSRADGIGPRLTKHTITDGWMSPFPSCADLEIKD